MEYRDPSIKLLTIFGPVNAQRALKRYELDFEYAECQAGGHHGPCPRPDGN